MATFFGEVTEVSSRAVWWSDEDEDEQNHKEPSIRAEVTNGHSVETFRARCKLLYLSIYKREPPLANEASLMSLQLHQDDDNSKAVNVASLYQLNETDYWLAINTKVALGPDAVHLVDYVADKILSGLQSNFDLLLVSKDLNRFNYLQYFSNNLNSNLAQTLLAFQKSIEMKPFICPETVKNDLELAFLEYSIVNKVNFVCVILPSTLLGQLSLIPKPLTESLNEFSNLSFSNIIT